MCLIDGFLPYMSGISGLPLAGGSAAWRYLDFTHTLPWPYLCPRDHSGNCLATYRFRTRCLIYLLTPDGATPAQLHERSRTVGVPWTALDCEKKSGLAPPHTAAATAIAKRGRCCPVV